jgi:AcrR family transcriptional regulator
MAKLGPTAMRTKSAIMASALRLFKEFGFDAVTVEDITNDAKVSKGSFYTYFSTKSDIIVDEFLKIDEYYRTWSEKNLKRYGTTRQKLLAFTRAQMRYVRDNVGNAYLKILYANQTVLPGRDKILTKKERQWVRIVTDLITEGQSSGEFRTDLEADRLATLFNRTIRGVFLDWCIRDAEFDLVNEGLSVVNQWALMALCRHSD